MIRFFAFTWTNPCPPVWLCPERSLILEAPNLPSVRSVSTLSKHVLQTVIQFELWDQTKLSGASTKLVVRVRTVIWCTKKGRGKDGLNLIKLAPGEKTQKAPSFLVDIWSESICKHPWTRLPHVPPSWNNLTAQLSFHSIIHLLPTLLPSYVSLVYRGGKLTTVSGRQG